MSAPQEAPHDEPDAAPAGEVSEATLRRAPRLGVFLVAGALLGALGTLIATSLFEPDPEVGFAASFGYFLIYGVPFGVLVGALIGLAFDRRSKRRARTVAVQHDRVD